MHCRHQVNEGTNIRTCIYFIFAHIYSVTHVQCIAKGIGTLTSTCILSIIAVARVIGKRSIRNPSVEKFLEKYFKLNSSPTRKARRLIAERLQVSLQSINDWFQIKTFVIKSNFYTPVSKEGQ